MVSRVRKHEVEPQTSAQGRHARSNGTCGRSCSEASENDNVTGCCKKRSARRFAKASLERTARDELKHELELFREEIGDFQFALSRPYFTNKEKEVARRRRIAEHHGQPLHLQRLHGVRAKFAMTMRCDGSADRRNRSKTLRRNWDFWQDLPTTPKKYIRVEDIEQGIGALETILLDKQNYSSLASGDGACLGCGEKSIMHLFTATIEALMQPRVERHVALPDRVDREAGAAHSAESWCTKSMSAIRRRSSKIIDDIGNDDVTLAGIAERFEKQRGGEPIDQQWLRRVTGLLAQLKKLKWKYTEGTTGRGRANAGILQCDRLFVGLGQHLPVQSLSVPLVESSVPRSRVDGDGCL